MPELRALPCTPSTATVVRLVPDLDDELTSALARMEEFLLLIAAWTREAPDEAPRAPIGDGTALAALCRIGNAIRPTQGHDRPRLLAPDGHYEHLPIRPVRVHTADLASWDRFARQVNEAPRSDPFGLIAEAIDAADIELPSPDRHAPSILLQVARLGRLLAIEPTERTRPIWERLGGCVTAETVLTPAEEIAYSSLADQVVAAWHGDDPLSRWMF